jgi:NADH dehydrogenase [ubiquinone] 1 alpha subcomplex assembly factor 1
MSAGAEDAVGPRLFDFSRAEDVASWGALDDRVMGGVSRSALVAGDHGTAFFRGQLSRERGGGFASVRSAPRPHDLRAFQGVAVRFRGDGRTYFLRLRSVVDLDGPVHQAAFGGPPGRWCTASIRFAELRPSFRGRPTPEAAPLDLQRVTTLGLLVRAETVGDFALELAWIAVF